MAGKIVNKPLVYWTGTIERFFSQIEYWLDWDVFIKIYQTLVCHFRKPSRTAGKCYLAAGPGLIIDVGEIGTKTSSRLVPVGLFDY